MGTLTERLAELEPRLAALRRGNDERSLLVALRTRNAQVAAVRDVLNQQLIFLGRVERLGGKLATRPRASAALRGKPEVLSTRVEKNAEEVAMDSSQWESTFLAPLRAFSEKLRAAVLDAWQALVDQHAQAVPDDVLDQLERLGLTARVSEVRAARERVRELRGRVPADDGVLKEIDNLAEGIARELGTLKALPRSVRSFLAKASKKDAALDDLTEEVQEWLRERDMLKLIRIGFR
jgi:hypothetical protein